MKHSTLQKHYHANFRVACSGNRLCYECRIERKKNKRYNNKAIRRLNRQLVREESA